MKSNLDTIYAMYEICEQIAGSFETYSALRPTIDLQSPRGEMELLHLQKTTFSTMLHSIGEMKKQHETLDVNQLPDDEVDFFKLTECKKLIAPIMEKMNELTDITNGHSLSITMIFWDGMENMELTPYLTDAGCLAEICLHVSKLLCKIYDEEILERTCTSGEPGRPFHQILPSKKFRG